MEKAFIHPKATISKDCSIGAGTKVWINAQVRENAVVGENCIIGKDTYIDHDVKVGNGVKIQNGVSIYHGVHIEADVFVGPNAVFTNDSYPRAFRGDWEVGRTWIRTGASIGANATIVCGTTLGRYCMVGAGSVVTRDVPDFALVKGNPARIAGYVCICGARLNAEGGCEKCGRTIHVAGGAGS